ncbi:MAG: hypothetical protein QXR88_02385, partial [Candidatus Pacearchaeota archaeon]
PAIEIAKILLLRENINKLESRLGKTIPIKEIKKELEGRINEDEIDEIIDKLKRSGDIYEPKKGYIEKI